MDQYKGTGIAFMRKLAKERGLGESVIEARLSTEDIEVYRALTAMTWVPTQAALRILEAGAEVLYPGSADGTYEINRLMAQDNMNGIYKILLRVVSVRTLIDRAAKLWSMYFSKGKGHGEGDPEVRAVTFVLEEYPELPDGMLKVIAGFLHGLLELTGAKDIHIAIDGANPLQWRWRITWN